jgi:hypothetical protein
VASITTTNLYSRSANTVPGAQISSCSYPICTVPLSSSELSSKSGVQHVPRVQFRVTDTQLMGQGKRIPEEVRWIIIRLSTTMTEEEVAMYTDVSVRTVRKILAYFRQTGGVEGPKQIIPRAHNALCEYDILVRITPFMNI